MLPRVQKLRKEFANKREIAYKYFSMFSIFNELKLTEKQIQLLSYIASNGHIGSINSKEEFIKTYKTTINVMNNLICKLYKKKLLVKIDQKIRINPKINIDFQEKERDQFIFIFQCLYQKELKTE